MSDLKKSWEYDPAARTVMEKNGHSVICIVPPRQFDGIGQLLAAAPTFAALATDLHAQLGESLSAWHGEEDSVQEEHADLIKNLEAADARATALFAAPGVALPAGALREMAHALLTSAQQLDGMQPYVITHSHRHGETYYTTWSATPPTEEQMAALLVEEYEPERGESLGYYGMAIADMTGTQIPERAGSDDADQDDEGVSERAPGG